MTSWKKHLRLVSTVDDVGHQQKHTFHKLCTEEVGDVKACDEEGVGPAATAGQTVVKKSPVKDLHACKYTSRNTNARYFLLEYVRISKTT